MNLLDLIRQFTPERVALERAALKAVCACLYYDLADCIDSTCDQELIDIINRNYDCELCGLKGSNSHE